MLLSAEIRWFWEGDSPPGLRDWFMDQGLHGCPPGGGPPGRQDVYLLGEEMGELGIKVRGAKGASAGIPSGASRCAVEVKGLVAVDREALTSGPFAGPVEIWAKWSFPRMDIGGTRRAVIRKTRWLRRFDVAGARPLEVPLGPDEWPLEESRRRRPPTSGCNVELTEVGPSSGEGWSTFGLEAFGELAQIAGSLRDVAHALAQRGAVPDLSDGQVLSYPRWIVRHVARPSSVWPS